MPPPLPPERLSRERLLIEAVAPLIPRGHTLEAVILKTRGAEGLSTLKVQPSGLVVVQAEAIPHMPQRVGPTTGGGCQAQTESATTTSDSAAPQRASRDVATRPLARQILEILKERGRPAKGSQLAVLCGKEEADGGFRGLLGKMKRRSPPLIRRVAGGYVLDEAGRAIVDVEGAEEGG